MARPCHQARISYAGCLASGYIIFDPETGAGAYKISGGANGSLMQLVQNVVSYIGAFIGLVKERLGIVIDAINTLFKVIDSLMSCPSPVGAWIAGLAIVFFLVSVMITIIVAILISGPLGAAIGVLVAFILGAFLEAWLEAVKRRWCGRRSKQRRTLGLAA